MRRAALFAPSAANTSFLTTQRAKGWQNVSGHVCRVRGRRVVQA
jgi:hypothetical protein